jgi:hypothetical protein
LAFSSSVQRLAEHPVRVVGWSLDLGRDMRVALDEDAYRLCEALDEALAVAGEPPPPEPPPVALIWRDGGRTVRLVVLRSPGPADAQLEGVGGRRVRVEQAPRVITLIAQGWAARPESGWGLQAWGGGPNTLALLSVSSDDEGDGAWARRIVRSLRFAAR